MVQQPSDNIDAAVRNIMQLADQLDQRIPPRNVFAQSSGLNGTILLYHWPLGWMELLLLLVRVPRGDVSVELQTHYAP